MPRIYLSNSFYNSMTKNVLYKGLRKGKDRGKSVVISWIDIHCDWCKKFISRKRLGHITKNDSLILCEDCIKKHHKEYQREYMLSLSQDAKDRYNKNRREKYYGIKRLTL